MKVSTSAFTPTTSVIYLISFVMASYGNDVGSYLYDVPVGLPNNLRLKKNGQRAHRNAIQLKRATDKKIIKAIKQGGYKISAPEPTLPYYSNVAPEMQSSSSKVSYTVPAYKETMLKKNHRYKLAAKKQTKPMDYKNNRYGVKKETAVTNTNKAHKGWECKIPVKTVAHNLEKHRNQNAYKQVKPLNDLPNKKDKYKVATAKKHTKYAKKDGYKTTVSKATIAYTSKVAPIIGTPTPVRTPEHKTTPVQTLEPTSTAVRTLDESYASLVETPALNVEPVVTQSSENVAESENGASPENVAESIEQNQQEDSSPLVSSGLKEITVFVTGITLFIVFI